MHGTRRYWASVGLAGLLVVAAIVLAQPLLVAGAFGLGAWLLGQQCLFVWTVTQLKQHLRVEQTVAQTQVAVDERVTGHLTVERTAQVECPVTVSVTAGVPLEATLTQGTPTCRLSSTDRDATTTFSVEWPVATQADFRAPTVTVTGDQGLFQTTFTHAPPASPTVTVRPQQPRALHVGAGGDPVQATLGEHPGDKQISGLEPETVREYTPGDPLRQIDWNATARSTQLYVRQFTQRVDHETAMFMDHRTAMGTGRPGETKLAYAQQVALAVLEQAQSDGDPVGLYTIGDDGVTARHPPDPTTGTYSPLRTTIHDLTPTRTDEPASRSTRPVSTAAPTASASVREGETGAGRPPSAAKQAADALDRDTSAFATCLRPFFLARQTYVQRIATKPLYTTVRAYLTTGGGTARNLTPDRTVILTDDTNQAEVREAVNVARRHSDHVFVFLTPTVLFEPDGLSALDRAYERYTEFETFRQALAQRDGVSAFEVAPGDRLATLRTATPASVASR